MVNWREKYHATAWHAVASLGVVLLAGILVFGVWYPYPYRELSGGYGLFRLVVSVDIIIGPMLTLVVFNRAKPRAELWRDMAAVIALQLAALAYGMHTVYEARPVYLVYEVDRFNVITATDIDPEELAQAGPKFRSLPLWGIRLIGVRQPRDGADRLRALEQGLAGHDISLQPDWWQDLGESHHHQMRQRGKSLSSLRAKANAEQERQIDDVLAQNGLKDTEVIALPMVGRRGDWSVLLTRQDLRIVGYMPIDSF